MTELISADRCALPEIKRRKPDDVRIYAHARVGMTKAQYQFYMKNGGAKWLRGLIDEVRA